MHNRFDPSEESTIRQAKAFAQSDAGQQLFAYLQKTQGETLRTAMDQAASGNYDQVKKTMSALLASAEVRAMLEKMGR